MLSGPGAMRRRGRGVAVGMRSRTARPDGRVQITEPLPARDGRTWRQTRQESNPDLRGWSSPCFRYTTDLRSGRPGSNGPPRDGVPVLFPPELRPRKARPAGFEPASSAFARQRSLSTELRACEEPPAGVEPAPRPYEGRVLAVDTTEARVRAGCSRRGSRSAASSPPPRVLRRGRTGKRGYGASRLR
jgi:hypothetical protein